MKYPVTHVLPYTGVTVEFHHHSNALPPGYTVGPASCSSWLRFEGGPSGWWRPETKSQHKIMAELQHCETVLDVCLLCDNWYPEAS